MLKTSTNDEINKTKINQLYKTKSFQENMVPMYLEYIIVSSLYVATSDWSQSGFIVENDII